MKTPTHAYVGYRADGTPIMIAVDDGSESNADAVHEILAAGGHVERMTIDAARGVWLYRKAGAR